MERLRKISFLIHLTLQYGELFLNPLFLHSRQKLSVYATGAEDTLGDNPLGGRHRSYIALMFYSKLQRERRLLELEADKLLREDDKKHRLVASTTSGRKRKSKKPRRAILWKREKAKYFG